MRTQVNGYFAAVVLVLASFALRLALDPWLHERSPFLLFTVAIIIAAGRYGIGPGLCAMALSLVVATLAFLSPGFPPRLSPDDLVNLFVFLAAGAAMLVFAAHLKVSKERAVRLQAELQQAHTEASMGAMASILAHELNQPLAAASNYLAASKRIGGRLQGEEKAKLVAGLAQAEGQIHRAGAIIRHAREMVASKAAQREPASLRKLSSRVVALLQAGGTCADADVRVRIEAEADRVLVNSVQIEQVLMNLVRNACEAADGAAEISISARATGERALVEVRDHGPGIPEDRLETIFAAERQSNGGGLGLGLSICRAIVEGHGGSIWARNEEEGGASFSFTVPLAAERE